MGQSVKIIGGGKETTRYYGGVPTFIPTGDTADEIPLNPAIAGQTTVQGLLEALESRPIGAGAISHSFSFGDATPIKIATLQTISVIRVVLLAAFNGGLPTLRIGDSSSSDRLFPASKINLKKQSTWVYHPQVQYAIDTDIFLEIVASGSTAGNGLIFLEQ